MLVDVDGIELFVREFGRGDPVILVPPGPGLDGSAFFPWFERLEGHRLLAVDLSGHGRSGRGDPDGWTVTGWAALIARLAETLALEDYTLLGHSFGARVALQHAVDHPGRAARVVCSGGVAYAGALEHMEDTFASFGTPELRASVEAAFEAEESVKTSGDCHAAWMGQMPFFLAEPDGPALAELERSWRDIRYSPEMHRHDGFGEYDVRESLPRVSVPVLVITGREDRITRPAESEEIAALLPDSTLTIVEHAGHFPFAEQPKEYFGVLGTWLDRR
jgi:pimeloyl-ACP methyl ester carboxylesterase